MQNPYAFKMQKPKPYRARPMVRHSNGSNQAIEGITDVAKIAMVGGVTVGILGAFK